MVNRYKKFFIKLILFALCFLGVDYLSGYGFRYLENKALLHSPYVFTPRFEIERHDTLLQYIELKRILKEQDVELVEDLYHHEDLMNPVLFKDNAHLNDSGAQKFTKMLVEKIKE